MTSAGKPQPGRPGTSSPWTSPPPRPARYRLSARLSDILHGWLDGRRGIPVLPEDVSRAAASAAVPATEGDLALASDLSADARLASPLLPPGFPAEPGSARPLPHPDLSPESGPASPLPHPWTARMDVLWKEASELIESEKIQLVGDLAVLKKQATHFLMVRDTLTDEAADAAEKLEQARIPLSDQEREERRFAERNAGDRPDGLVRARRQTAWERRLDTAGEEYRSAATRLAEATREAQLREELIRDRAAVARAAARRHHELALRRIATYLQQLLRSHGQGPALNRLLVEYRVGPDLPEWTRDPAAGQSPIEQMFGGEDASSPSDSRPRNETSEP